MKLQQPTGGGSREPLFLLPKFPIFCYIQYHMTQNNKSLDDSQTLTGTISITGKGIGYFNTEPLKGRDGLSWEVQKEYLLHAFPCGLIRYLALHYSLCRSLEAL